MIRKDVMRYKYKKKKKISNVNIVLENGRGLAGCEARSIRVGHPERNG
jgi:hypothetical protein